MPKIPFNVHAYTARLIGRENVSKLEGAVLELVKNTYDADAAICVLYYEKSTKTLYLADNGIGMTEGIISTHWMTIGNSSKVNNYMTPSGRIQTGAKGIGRFALDRISDVCQMLTINGSTNLEWNVNWSDFNSGKTITEVYADLNPVTYSINDFFSKTKNTSLKKLVRENFKSTGTVFKLSSLRDEWSDTLVERIKNNLATLIPPEIENIFKVYFFCEDTEEEKAKVSMNNGLFSYDYKMDFSCELDGRIITKVYRNEFDFKGQFETIMLEAGFNSKDRDYFNGDPIIFERTIGEMLPSKNVETPNTIGKFSGVMYFSKQTSTLDEKEKYFYKDFSNRKDYRDTFGGIKMYRDHFRVRPYGEPKTSNYDWLLLSNRKTKSPAAISHTTGKWRVNSDQMIGTIYISRTNLTLPDQSNREGIVETKEFADLREILLGVLKFFEEDRQYVCRLLSKYYDATHFTEQYEKEINDKASKEEKNKKKKHGKYSSAPEYIEVSKVKTVLENKDIKIRDLEDENRLLRTLATTGIVTNTYIHEIKDSTHKLSMKIIMAKEALEFDDNKEEAIEYINAANEIKNSFNSWFKVTIESVRRDKRSMKEVNLQTLIQELITSWNEVEEDKGVHIGLEMEEVTFKCFPYEIESLLNNLLTNSFTSFSSVRVNNKEINIKVTSAENNGIIIDYHDTGVGLSAAYKSNPERILEAFETDKRNELGEQIGTGMGMWVIVKTVNEYNGTIDLSKNSSSENGFYISIVLNGK
ncbi:sensor histidine kinase [Paenibacillus anaericanus]|uniref:Sensor histidine kinase n=1 Tax=Paenibacillus anaericanus TaxID=170367 RepID=A0A3S1K646_9BACL|nr:sensor histidine kinase [Paenibacillus anaericanus]RUT44673.1 sensor histidine kinase [Paenibacillus anaericanus]